MRAGRRGRWWRLGAVALAAAVLAAGCSSDDGPDATSAAAPDTAATATTDPVPAVADEPISDPDSTDPAIEQGRAGTVAETASTAPADPAANPTIPDADDPAAALVPPSTLLVGDPRPEPGEAEPLPPLPPQPVIDACERLNGFSTADVVGAAAGAPSTVESIWDESCRFVAGSVVAEVHYVPESLVETDWFAREGIEPVGSVGGDAVGLVGFVPPGSSPGEGYTIALISRRHGVIVAVRGSGDDRLIAEQLAIIGNESV